MTSFAMFCPAPPYPPEYVCVSRHSSATFPIMSQKPQAFGGYFPTSLVLWNALRFLELVPTFTAEKRAFAAFVNVASSLRSSMFFSSSPMEIRFAAFGSKLSPQGIRVVVPARHAISHRTGSGSSNRYPSGSRSAHSSLILSMNRLTSFLVTASTGRFFPLYKDGLFRSNPSGRFSPSMMASHCSCVTSNLPSQYGTDTITSRQSMSARHKGSFRGSPTI